MIIPALLFAALLQAGGPHFSDSADTIATPGAAQDFPGGTSKVPMPITVTGQHGTQTASAFDAQDKVVCQTSRVTGTLIATSQCLTKGQWEQLARDGKEAYEGFSFKGGWGMDALGQADIAALGKR